MVYTETDELFDCLAIIPSSIPGPGVFTGSRPDPARYHKSKRTLNKCIQVEIFPLAARTAERM